MKTKIHLKKFSLTLLFSILLIGNSITHAKVLNYPDDGIGVSLPDKWIEIPKEVIQTMFQELARQVPNAEAQHYDYGYQLDSAEKWLEYPYILIQIKNSGRIPERELEKLEQYPASKEIEEQENEFEDLLSSLKMEKMHYDHNSGIIWMKIQFNIPNVGQVSCLTGMIPTEKGLIQVNGYSLQPDFEHYVSIFKDFTKNIIISKELKYQPEWSDKIPVLGETNWGGVISKAIAGAIVGGIVAFIIWLLRKKKR